MDMSELAVYDYVLPERLIAQYPQKERTNARLMVVDRNRRTIEHRYIRDLPEYLREGDTLVLNDTKVVPARLVGYRTTTRGRWEGLFLRFNANGTWEVLSKTRGTLQLGETLSVLDTTGCELFALQLEGRTTDHTLLVRPVPLPGQRDRLEPGIDATFSLLDRAGRVPLPPYIRSGEMNEEDRDHYQTVYAAHPGAVAAPTAGLHFTEELLDRIASAGIAICHVTLHVGMGTFKPITVERLTDHRMHTEYATISSQAVELLNRRRSGGGRVVAVGTTSVRVLESASNIAPDGTIDSSGRSEVGLAPFSGDTDLFIRPPYRFKTVDAMLTNFHLPKSTLIILVRTFGGEELIRQAYREAIEREYRFYSYGDAMFIF